MAIVRTAKGTQVGKNVTTLTIAGVSVAADSTLIVSIFWSQDTAITSVKIGATSFTADFTGSNAFYSLYSAAGVSGSVVVTFAGSNTYGAIYASQYTGLVTASAIDKTAEAVGVSTTPSSGATASTSQPDELLLGTVGTNGPSGDSAGTWGSSFNAGQRAGTTGGVATTNGTISEGYLVVSSAAAYTASKTGITSRAWAATIATYRGLMTAALGAGAAVTGADDLGFTSPLSVTLGAGSAAGSGSDVDQLRPVGFPSRDTATLVSEDAAEIIRPTAPTALGDQSVMTGESLFVGSPLASGTVELGASTMSDLVTPPDAIASLIFHAACYTLDTDTFDYAARITNHRFKYTVGGVTAVAALSPDDPTVTHPIADYSSDPVGAGDPVPVGVFVHSGTVTTQPNGQPWDTASVNALSDVLVAYDYTQHDYGVDGIHPAYLDLVLREIWVEVAPVTAPVVGVVTEFERHELERTEFRRVPLPDPTFTRHEF